ncbi:MAG: hypothetical protein BYD32DRAFT_17455 [Podila humilis]|nr:MAG: hypothetical protein BYD32DRAFT_17455 [Podila humilis]
MQPQHDASDASATGIPPTYTSHHESNIVTTDGEAMHHSRHPSRRLSGAHSQPRLNAQGQPLSGGMGDGIVNQHMREDLENWLTALGLDPNAPINVIGYFGQTRDLSIFERVQPRIEDDCKESSQDEETITCGDTRPHKQGSSISSHRLPVYSENDQDFDEDEKEDMPSETTGMSLGIGDMQRGDIHVYIDRPNNTLMLQHSYIYDSEEMLSICHESIEAIGKDRASLTKWLYTQEFESHRALLFLFLVSQVVVHTSTELTIDPRIISILLALSTTKRQIMQELDRFMTICWDRIGVAAPDQRKHLESGNRNGSPGNGAPSANIFTPGKCVPVLVFVVERVPITAPWFEADASEAQIMDVSSKLQLSFSVPCKNIFFAYFVWSLGYSNCDFN